MEGNSAAASSPFTSDTAATRSGSPAAIPGTFSVPPVSNRPERPHVLLAASGSVAAIKFCVLAKSLSDWADVKAVCSKSALHFFDPASLPPGVQLYTDNDEWASWNKLGDSVLHIELRKWADILLIAPLSANTLAKIAGGICDNLLTCIVRAWDFSKPMLIAPAMNTMMWDNPFTDRHLSMVEDLGAIVIPPISKRLACGDVGTGAMAEPSHIEATVQLTLRAKASLQS